MIRTFTNTEQFFWSCIFNGRKYQCEIFVEISDFAYYYQAVIEGATNDANADTSFSENLCLKWSMLGCDVMKADLSDCKLTKRKPSNWKTASIFKASCRRQVSDGSMQVVRVIPGFERNPSTDAGISGFH